MRNVLAIGMLCTALIVPSCLDLNLVDREDVVKSLGPLLVLERRNSVLKERFMLLTAAGLLEEEGIGKVRTHNDVYFVYYVAANVSLARGDFEDYFLKVQYARTELDSIEQILGEVLVVVPEAEPDGDRL